MKIIGIMAATEEGVIGYKNRLPWNYPQELEHFRTTTAGHILIMGRKTYEKTPQSAWGDRECVVLSRSAKVINSLDACMRYIQNLNTNKTVFMIGGAEIAHLFLENNLISSFILTKIHQQYPGDAFLDLSYFDGWSSSVLKTAPEYTICMLKP
ncbi:MAG: dihydrofolate reductase [Alphaproteobacteria bacterium]